MRSIVFLARNSGRVDWPSKLFQKLSCDMPQAVEVKLQKSPKKAVPTP